MHDGQHMWHSKPQIIPAASFSRLNMTLRPPLPAFSNAVQCLWAAHCSDTGLPQVTEKLYPDAGTSITFHIHNGSVAARYFHSSEVALSNWITSKEYFGVRFKPGGAAALLGEQLANIQNEEVDLMEINLLHKESLKRLLDQLSALKSVNQRIDMIQNWLAFLASNSERNHWSALAANALTHALSIQELASDYGFSRRTLERHFRKYIGFTPSQVNQFGKLNRARWELTTSRNSISDIALNCGFFDQAHFSNFFRENTMETPLQYRQRKLSQISNT
ncbi:transcriptional regulator, AraC family [Pseudidiomarina planktonica]|uniref:Transcriptional regulator, AraC family n=2 Tax=Pseudidiomarina planktonica TaxID=1323738 RepID=A0A1Y6G0A9_9GAMM|nr:transcriptional regulator, AraC family [Pseudidiomarina planktonica]